MRGPPPSHFWFRLRSSVMSCGFIKPDLLLARITFFTSSPFALPPRDGGLTYPPLLEIAPG